MNTQKITMETIAVYSDDNQHRFLLEKSWGTDKKAMIIMLYPCASDLTQLDLTTMLCLNNAARLGYSGISVVTSTAIPERFSLIIKSQKPACAVEFIPFAEFPAMLQWNQVRYFFIIKYEALRKYTTVRRR